MARSSSTRQSNGSSRAGMSLHALSISVGILLAAMSLVVAGALVLLTSYLHGHSAALRDSVGSVRLAREAEVALVRHEHASSSLELARYGAAVQKSLADVRTHVTSPDQQKALDGASMAVERYLAASRGRDLGPAARVALGADAEQAIEELVQETLTVANRARDRVDVLDSVANVVGVGAACIMLGTLLGVALWIRRAVILPTLDLSNAIRRFSSGARTERAREYGAREIYENAASFNEMATLLEQQRETRVTQIAGIAHDLRNPLGALELAVGLIDPERPLPDDERTRHVLKVLRRQLERLNRMVSDLVDAARIESGHLDVHMAEVDLRSVVITVVDLYRDSSPIHTVESDVPDAPVHARCDAHRIEQALSNLVSNAIKYSPQGGEVRVVLRSEATECDASFTVSDTGVGIASGEIESIWQPFSRGLSSAAWVPGVGLGLSSVKRIVEAHGGRVEVESVVGAGSTFTLHLPTVGPVPVSETEATRLARLTPVRGPV